MLDKLIVKGIPALNGEYECDVIEMLSLDQPESMTNREGHRIKQMSGVRAGEYEDALEAGDNDFMVALAAIVLTRRGKRFDESVLWDAPMGSGVTFEIGEREEEGEDPDPPSAAISETPPQSGGSGGDQISESQVSDPSVTGAQPSDTTSISDPATSAT
jgi:hypothetical protein